jgi:hypothetical protein
LTKEPELHWEGHRRTDLVRFGKFLEEVIYGLGKVMYLEDLNAVYRDLFPIPATALASNSKLIQNPGII